MSPVLIWLLRGVVALVWIYEGLWLKVIRQAPHELQVVASVGIGWLPPKTLLFLIGSGETLLGIGVLTGLYARFLAWFQILLLLAMNAVGIVFGHGSISDPAGLLIHNLPFLACIAILGLCSPNTSRWKCHEDLHSLSG